jgi:hypothetical protein
MEEVTGSYRRLDKMVVMCSFVISIPAKSKA